MAIYAYIYDDVIDTRTNTTKELNTILTSLQRQDGEIKDIRISTVERTIGVFRSILIIYEADNIIHP
jgi:hypothetical protein